MRTLALALIVVLASSSFAQARRRHHRSPRSAVIERCLARAGVTPPLKLVASLTVSWRGRVTHAHLTQGALPTTESQTCVLGELRQLRFPAGHPGSVLVPVLFVGSVPRPAG